MKKTYTRPKIKKMGFNYISQKRTKGMLKITSKELSERSNKEVNKFFKSSIAASSKEIAGLDPKENKAFIDIESDKFKNFSPSLMIFGEKEMETTKLLDSNMDANFFNNFKITRASLKEESDSSAESEAIANTVEFPGGITIYGRWNRVSLHDGSCDYTDGIIVYYGPA